MGSGRKKRSTVLNLALVSLAGLAGFALYRLAKRTRIELHNQHLQRGRCIVILGAGFAGRHAAIELARQLPQPGDGDIILVDERAYLLYTPMLTEAAGGEVDPHHIVSPVHRLPSRVTFLQGRVEQVDLRERRVVVRVGNHGQGIPEATRVLQADQLVLALGSVTDYHGIPGLQEHSLVMKNLQDAALVRNRVLAMLERASEEDDPVVRRALLTVVVGGGGYTGLETMAALNDLLRATIRDYPHLDPAEIRTVLVDPGDRLLPEMTESMAEYAQSELQNHGVEVRLGRRISAAGPGWVELDGEERIQTHTLIWAGGVTANPMIKNLACDHGHHGTVTVNPFLAVPGRAGIWALGDCAEIPMPDRQGYYAPTAQNAFREGQVVARNIVAVLRAENPVRFEYRPAGELAVVGRHSAVARLFRFRFSGLPAWVMWRLIYLSKMPSLPQKIRIFSDWVVDFVFGRNPARMRSVPGKQKQQARSQPSSLPV